MKRNNVFLIIVGVAVLVFLVYSFAFGNDVEETFDEDIQAQEKQVEQETQKVEYFSLGSDEIVIEASKEVLSLGETTTLSYYALDSEELVHFKEGDRAFVRILGVTHYFVNNTEIFHPEGKFGNEDRIFSGDFSFGEPGKYLVKVCLGESINLDETGRLVWPWGCFEDGSFKEINVYEN